MEDLFNPKSRLLRTQVLIIGGGATGTGLARDLALRGVECLLVEKKDLNAGASGGNHGLLHSGARYIASDPEAAKECREEGKLLKQIAPHCIEDTGGFFVAVEGDDETYIADFPGRCDRCGIPTQSIDLKEARFLEPALSQGIIAVYAVRDAAIDPFRLSLDNMDQARRLGAGLLCFTRVLGFDINSTQIRSVKLQNTQTGEVMWAEADIIVNAAGAWAGLIAGLAGISIPVLYSKGSLLITHDRLTQRVINRLRPASNADIVVPGGTVSILGTTSVRIENPDEVYPTVEEIDLMVEDARTMIPALETARYIRAYCGVRPLIGSQGAGDDRKVSRGFTLLDHGAEGVENFFTISGGKLTTYRLMAEKTADLVCHCLGISKPCLTRTEPLPASLPAQWTEPASAPKIWLKEHGPEDIILCECEMVPRSTVDSIVDSIHEQGEGQTSRESDCAAGSVKAPVRGLFAGRVLPPTCLIKRRFDIGRSLDSLRDFVRSRWKGLHPILWGQQLQQADLLEAMHCGLFGLEFEDQRSPLDKRGEPFYSRFCLEPLQCDLTIIGAGMAGMAATLFAANRGLSVAQVGNTSEIGFASGFFDLLGIHPMSEGKRWDDPWAGIETLVKDNPGHPYARLGQEEIRAAFDELLFFLEGAGLSYSRNPDRNVKIVTPLGTVKTTYCTPRTMWAGVEALEQKRPCLIVEFKGLKGFSAGLIAENLKDLWPGLRTVRVLFPGTGHREEVLPEHMANALVLVGNREKLARLIRPEIKDAQCVGLPAVLGLYHSSKVISDLTELIGVPVFEIPTMPPSIPGLRLKEAFERGLREKRLYNFSQKRVIEVRQGVGGTFEIGIDSATGKQVIISPGVILATGRFIGGGLTADRKHVRETIFNLPIFQPERRKEWHREDFLDRQGHSDKPGRIGD